MSRFKRNLLALISSFLVVAGTVIILDPINLAQEISGWVAVIVGMLGAKQSITGY